MSAPHPFGEARRERVEHRAIGVSVVQQHHPFRPVYPETCIENARHSLSGQSDPRHRCRWAIDAKASTVATRLCVSPPIGKTVIVSTPRSLSVRQ